MKVIECKECKKSFKINYYYTHKKSKKHLLNCKKDNKLLLFDEDKNNNIRNTKLFLQDLKDKIEEFISQL